MCWVFCRKGDCSGSKIGSYFIQGFQEFLWFKFNFKLMYCQLTAVESYSQQRFVEQSRVLGHGCFDLSFIYLVLIPVFCFVVLFSVLFRL